MTPAGPRGLACALSAFVMLGGSQSLAQGPKWTKAEEDELTDAMSLFNKKGSA